MARRGLDLVPVLHGGGQERGVRSGTLDAPAVRAFAVAADLAAQLQAESSARLAALRDQLVAAVLTAVPDAVLRGDPDPAGRLPGNAHFTFPGCEGDSLLYLLDARGVECSTGSACQAGVPQPSHVLLAMGVEPDAARGALRFSLGWHVDAGRRRRRRRGDRPRGRAGPARGSGQRRDGAGPAGHAVRVLAAMSGGVDSAVAAARAVDAGHEVVGVHLALARNPATLRTGARGCCTVEDARDARRAADVLGIPFYVWDLAERFERDVVDDFVAEYAAGRTPNPCVRCNERIKFSALLDKALALGFDAVCTGHYARLVVDPATGAPTLHRAVDTGKDQSYVLAVLTPQRLRRAIFPLGDTAKADVRSRGRRARAAASPPSPTRTTSASWRTATPRRGWRSGWADAPGPSSTPAAACSASTTAPTPTRSASVTGCDSAGRRRTGGPATCSRSGPRPTPSSSVRGRRSRPTSSRRAAATWCGPSPAPGDRGRRPGAGPRRGAPRCRRGASCSGRRR